MCCGGVLWCGDAVSHHRLMIDYDSVCVAHVPHPQAQRAYMDGDVREVADVWITKATATTKQTGKGAQLVSEKHGGIVHPLAHAIFHQGTQCVAMLFHVSAPIVDTTRAKVKSESVFLLAPNSAAKKNNFTCRELLVPVCFICSLVL